MPSDRIVLASASPWRREMLERAGLAVEAVPSTIDERSVEAPLLAADALPSDIALVLAQAKAEQVSQHHGDAWTIGCDQVLELDGSILHKVADMEDARRRLLELSGRTHHLHSAVVLARGGETEWTHLASPAMTMRTLDPGFVGRHLASAGEAVLGSVGAYQIEGPGIQLFERIEGDFFSVVGLPLLPLLDALRARGAIDG